MMGSKGMLLTVLCAGYEIMWLYAWAVFAVVAGNGFYSFPGSVIVFALGAVITHFSIGKGWRVISVGAAYLSGFTASLFLVIYLSNFLSFSFLSADWIVLYFKPEWAVYDRLNFIQLIFWTIAFWVSGVFFARRPKTYYKVCARFDIGIAAFFCLFILKLVISERGGIHTSDPSFALVFPFFILGILAVGVARIKNSSKSFMPGFRGIGITAGIGIIGALFVLVVVLLLPVLTRTADVSYRILKSGAEFALPAFVIVIRFFFGMGLKPKFGAKDDAAAGGSGLWDYSGEGSHWKIVELIFQYGLTILVAMAGILILGCLLYRLFKWLFSKTAADRQDAANACNNAPWFVRLWRIVLSALKIILRSLKGYHKAVELYRMLLLWGRHSGISRRENETPLEYGTRLNCQFPRLKSEIDTIVGALNIEIYRGADLPRELISGTRRAWRRLRSPRNWPSRMKSIFLPGKAKNK